MGWNTWCTDDLCGALDICTEYEVKSIADAIVSQGLDKLGYNYVNLDDCWSDTKRDAQGRLQPVQWQFPSGMKALADYVHVRGLKLGLYTDAGTETCRGGRPGSYGFYDIDAQTMAAWGVDFVKADYCHRPPGVPGEQLYANFSRALNATGRPILFSICSWGSDDVISWGYKYAQMSRIQQDHIPFWSWPPWGAGEGFGQGTANIIEYAATLRQSTKIKKFGWLDPDFLETLFWPTMNFVDSRTEFSFWSLWSAPLVIATDLRNLTAEKKAIITNPEVIAVDQDPLITAGERVANYTKSGAPGQVWVRPLSTGEQAVILYNPQNVNSSTITVTWNQLGWPAASNVAVRDLWLRKDLGQFGVDGFTATVKPHDISFVRVKRV